MRIQVKDFMSAPVLTATEKNSIGQIRALMDRKGVHAIPIIEYSKKLPQNEVTIKGIVTVTDLSDDLDNHAHIKAVMTPKVYIIHKDSSAQSAAKMMLKQKVHHLVVMDEGKIVGIISSLDFVTLVATHSLGKP